MAGLSASYRHFRFHFGKPSGTSRGVLTHRDSYFIILRDPDAPYITGIGECCLLPGLSPDLNAGLEKKLKEVCHEIQSQGDVSPDLLEGYPAVQMALETALLDLKNGGRRMLFPSQFTDGLSSIPINGLIWMGSHEDMKAQIDRKIAGGYRVLKMKVGAVDFDDELALLRYIREQYAGLPITLRLDANGAFPPHDAMFFLEKLAAYQIHSIEQPIKPGNPEMLAALCRQSPVPVALDEELIGRETTNDKAGLLDAVRPDYIILKPSLLGGFRSSEEWIRLAEERAIAWWVTSALESNIGLNAIAQWTATLGNNLTQGLGTGGLFTNNLKSPLYIHNAALRMQSGTEWDTRPIWPEAGDTDLTALTRP